MHPLAAARGSDRTATVAAGRGALTLATLLGLAFSMNAPAQDAPATDQSRAVLSPEDRRGDTPARPEPAPTGDAAAPAADDTTDPLPPELAGLDVVEHLNGSVPLDLAFTDQDGRPVRLAQYFDGRRPVILNLQYFRCPMLCGLVLNAMLSGLKELEWTAGEQFRVLTVSFDPLETAELAYQKRQNYLAEYGRPAAAGGWDFLTGQRAPIAALLAATGFPARWDERQQQWLHPAALLVLTPDGRISRYLYGINYSPGTLRLALLEASQGRIGSTADRLLLWCFHYDPAQRGYALAAWRLVRAGGLLTALVLGTFLTLLWRHERRRRPPAAAGVPAPDRMGAT
jgi:protein SCO1/2